MHLHFGTQSLNVRLSIEKPGKKGKELTVLVRPAICFFKTLLAEATEINETDSRIQTSCPKYYLEFWKNMIRIVCSPSATARWVSKGQSITLLPMKNIAVEENRTMNISTDLRCREN